MNVGRPKGNKIETLVYRQAGKIECSNCDNWYKMKDKKCPNCGEINLDLFNKEHKKLVKELEV